MRNIRIYDKSSLIKIGMSLSATNDPVSVAYLTNIFGLRGLSKHRAKHQSLANSS